MELINLKKYSKSISNTKYYEYIDKALEEADKQEKDPNTKYLTHEEVFEIKEETKYLECIYLIF